MKIIELSLDNITSDINELHLCLGFFDAIHIGHQKIIKEAVKNSDNVGVLTFDIAPSYKLGYRDNERTITSLYDRSEALDKLGVKYMFVLSFNDELVHLDYLAFIHCVIDQLHPSKIYCGEDYTFGYLGKGKPKDLQLFYDVVIVPKVLGKSGEKISSRTIIEYIKNGDIEKANELLGRNYSLTGIVEEGKQLGRQLGFPTANVELDYPNVLPKEGVYACYAIFEGNKYKAVMSFSRQPTFRLLDEPIFEVHLIDFNEDIYGLSLTIELVHYLREIKRFDDKESLINQLNIDVKTAHDTLI